MTKTLELITYSIYYDELRGYIYSDTYTIIYVGFAGILLDIIIMEG